MLRLLELKILVVLYLLIFMLLGGDLEGLVQMLFLYACMACISVVAVLIAYTIVLIAYTIANTIAYVFSDYIFTGFVDPVRMQIGVFY